MMESTGLNSSTLASETRSLLRVTVHFVFHVDAQVAPRQLQVECPLDATVQDLTALLGSRYGAGLENSLAHPNLMAIINGVSHGKRLQGLRLRTASETDIDIWFMHFNDHGG